LIVCWCFKYHVASWFRMSFGMSNGVSTCWKLSAAIDSGYVKTWSLEL